MVELNATLLAQIINFLILVAILKKMFYRKILDALAERQTRIAQSMENAERDRQAAEELKREYQEQLAAARAQAQQIVEKATRLAEQNREEILAEARAEHARMMAAAREEILRDRERAMNEVRGEVVALSIAAASKLIEKNMDTEADARLVADFIARLDERKAGGLPC